METWTKGDVDFLRSIAVASEDQPAPMGRYRVEPSDVEGWYRVTDSRRRFRSVYEFGPGDWEDPRAAAEDMAAQMNARK